MNRELLLEKYPELKDLYFKNMLIYNGINFGSYYNKNVEQILVDIIKGLSEMYENLNDSYIQCKLKCKNRI